MLNAARSEEFSHSGVLVQDLANDIDDVEQRSWARLAEWMKQRYHAECSAVSGLHRLASQAAFDGQPLPYQLDLQVCPHCNHLCCCFSAFTQQHIPTILLRILSSKAQAALQLCLNMALSLPAGPPRLPSAAKFIIV